MTSIFAGTCLCQGVPAHWSRSSAAVSSLGATPTARSSSASWTMSPRPLGSAIWPGRIRGVARHPGRADSPIALAISLPPSYRAARPCSTGADPTARYFMLLSPSILQLQEVYRSHVFPEADHASKALSNVFPEKRQVEIFAGLYMPVCRFVLAI